MFNTDFPDVDPADGDSIPYTPDSGQVLFRMAFGAEPEDFPPNLQPLAQGYSPLFQAQPPATPGLLGSPEAVRSAIAPSSDAGVSSTVAGPRRALPTTYPKSLDPIVDRCVGEYNQAHGLRPGDREYLDPDLVRAMIRQEAGHDYEALIGDPMQVNASSLDWDRRKADLGLRRGVAPGPDLGVKAGIQWLRMKAYPHDAQGHETRFIGWSRAVQKYNAHMLSYSDQVWDHLGEIKAGF
jgi:hypothetical protein